MNTFETSYQEHTNGSYCIWDRLVIRAFIGTLQREAHLVYFLKEICGIKCITPEVLKEYTEKFVNSVEQFAHQYQIPIETAPSGKRKQEYAQSFFEKFDQEEGVFLILKSFETANTFISYKTKRQSASNPNYRKITRAKKQVNHYYFYIKDRQWGMCSIKICSYLPFAANIYLNGHNFAISSLENNGIGYTKIDNCFIDLDDFTKAQQLFDKITVARIQSLGDRWLSRLVNVFTADQKRQLGLSYRYSIAQIEFSHNLIFKQASALDQLFERLTDQNRRIGRPDIISTIFEKRITVRYSGKLQTTLDTRNNVIPVLKSWYKSSFIKQYAKWGRVLRSELCINDTYDIDIGRKLENLPNLWQKAQQIMERYLEQLDTILLSFVDRSIAYALAETTVEGSRRVPGIKLDNQRLMAVIEAVEQFPNLVNGFTNRTLREQVTQLLGATVQEYTPGQMQYDLSKLRAKGLVEKKPGQNTYVLTRVGFQICVLITKLRRFILEPLLTGIKDTSDKIVQEAKNLLDKSYMDVDQSLLNLCSVVGISLK